MPAIVSVMNEKLDDMAAGIQAVPDAVLDDLRARLQRTRWPSVVDGQGWTKGTDLQYLGELVDLEECSR
ncbi:MAG: epoxide hydrolase N-terminal domain-containing protein [Propionibacteriaceae bacterium]